MEHIIKTEDGANLFVRCIGSGETLLLIHGACVDSEFFVEFAELMAEHFFVITYDRRGYGNSTLGMLESEDTSDPDGKISDVEYYSLQASDAKNVLEEMNTIYKFGCKANVLGCSAGAIVAAYFAASNPDMILKVFLHEPPLYSLVLDSKEIWIAVDEIHELIAQKKYHRASNRFILFHASHSGPTIKPMTETEIEHFEKNNLTFIKKEYTKAFGKSLSVDGVKGQNVVVLYGKEDTTRPLVGICEMVAKRLECSIYPVPGAHNGVRDLPDQFADAFIELV